MKYSRMVMTYVWKNLNCELCKGHFPHSVWSKKRNLKFELLDYSLPNHKDLLVIETLNAKNNKKMIHVIDFSENERIVIGRHVTANVRINDITVSRYHSNIQRFGKGDDFFITDNLSKFGTLVQIKRPLKLSESEFNFFQVGNRLIEFDVRKKTKRCLCFDIPILSSVTNHSLAQQLYH